MGSRQWKERNCFHRFWTCPSNSGQSLPGIRLINFPDCQPEEVAGTRIVRQGKRNQDALKIHERIDGRGNPYYWLGFGKRAFEEGSDTDLWALQNNYVSVTPLSLDLTNEAARESLMTHFS